VITVHGELTKSGDQIILIAAGPIEAVAFAARMLESATPLFEPSDPPGALVVRASWPAVVQLQAIYGAGFVAGPRLSDWIGEQLALRTAPLGGPLRAPVPDDFEPRSYQVEGAQMFAQTGRALIFDEPRTGKTVTTILGLLERAGDGMTRGLPVLAVVPASTVDPWCALFERIAPHWNTVAWRGPRRIRHQGKADIYVTSYDTATVDAKDTNPRRSPLIALEHRSLVVDECHYLKNPEAKRTKAVTRLGRNVEAFVALSGTPITHHADGLLPTLRMLAPGAWPNKERWVARYMLSRPNVDYGQGLLGLNPYTEREFRLTMLGQHRRVARADVMSQLPPKTYSVRTVRLPAAHRKAYDDFKRDMITRLPDGQELSVMGVLTQINFLSQLACAAADVEYEVDVDPDTGEEKPHTHIKLKAPSWKVDALLEVLEERPGERTVCFSTSAQLCRLAGEAASAAGYRVGYIIGGQAMGVRTGTIAAFQAGELDLICATTGAGGTGITLSEAGTLVFLQRPYSLVESLQAEDRGEGDLSQTRGTEIVDIVAEGTVDTDIRAVLYEKAGNLADLVQDPRVVEQLLGGASVIKLKAHVA